MKTDEALAALDRDGFVILPSILSQQDCVALREASDRLWSRERGARSPFLHYFDFVNADPTFLRLLDRPAMLEIVAGVLGTNIYVYHCHLDVAMARPLSANTYDWHQDAEDLIRDVGGYSGRPISLKAAFFLSDMSVPNHGATRAIPASHRSSALRPERLNAASPSEIPFVAAAGSCAIFDCRLWHSRGPHTEGPMRYMAFLAFAPLWVRPRDRLAPPSPQDVELTPVQRQLLGVVEDPREFHISTRFPRALRRLVPDSSGS